MAVQPPPPRPIEVLPPPPRPSDVPRCLMLPPSRTIRLFDRVDVFQNLDKSLGPDVRGTSFRSVALHGIGGVGKSSVACSYMEARFKESVYDVGLWVSGEKPASLRQSFTDIALRLKLPGANPQHHEANFHLVHDWLQSTDRSWLVVYDNVESAEILMPYWPTSTNGRAIITTRNDSLAFEPASDGLEVTSWDDKTGSKFLLHLLKKNIDRQSAETVDDSAFALAKRLGGHALMISQMAGLIHRYKFPIEDFLAVYLRNPQTTHERDEFKAIWEASFASLSKDSKPLMGVISFLMPDNITPEIFANVEGRHFPADLSFCDNDFRLLEALAELFGLALVKKDEDTGIMSVHRMVQTQFKYFLSPEQRLRYFENAVALIFDLFPSEDIEVGQMYENWEMCNRHIQHVINLRDCFAEEQKLPGNFQVSFKLCELLLRSQRFLLESNEMKDFEETCRVNLMVVECLEPGAQKESYKATIISHQAQMAENLGDHETAIRLHKEDYKIQLAKQPRNLYFLSYTAGNLGYSYSSAGNQTEALKWFQTSREWWSNMPNRPLNILVNEARAYILLGDLETAEKLLDSFEKQARSDKSQGWAMNADGYFAIGVFDLHRKDFESAEQHFSAARQAWLKGDQTRLHPFYGACLYKLGVVYLSQGKVEAAINHLRDSVVITQADKDKRPAEHARVLFKLSEALSQDASDDSLDEAVKLRDEAEVYLRKQDPNTNNFSTDEAYDRFVTLDRR
ncbi:Tetratricopeptide-like helical [Bombardia bombarda]|uniref:Tetratricopeptide-like helical n=1 Tax=Bombardia bombarda TaxID=252184 RepID=A0AA39TLY4_9PEZI|nr:Tetratricopeptide-like helical [Bombardia bombarda]